MFTLTLICPQPLLQTKQMQLISFPFYLSFKICGIPQPSFLIQLYLYKILSPPDDEIIQALPVPPLIIYEEIRSAIKTLNQNSAPSLDGFTANFYSSFPSLISFLCRTLIIFSSANNSLPLIPCSQKKLIPKTPNPNTVNNWRPIALLNANYKILSSIISSRLKPLLNFIISPERQCGFPNMQIFNNHLNILSAIHYTNNFFQPLTIL